MQRVKGAVTGSWGRACSPSRGPGVPWLACLKVREWLVHLDQWEGGEGVELER